MLQGSPSPSLHSESLKGLPLEGRLSSSPANNCCFIHVCKVKNVEQTNESISFYKLIFRKYAPSCNVSALKFYTFLLEIPHWAHSCLLARTCLHTPRLVLTGLDFGEAGTETVSAPFISGGEVKERVICLGPASLFLTLPFRCWFLKGPAFKGNSW